MSKPPLHYSSLSETSQHSKYNNNNNTGTTAVVQFKDRQSLSSGRGGINDPKKYNDDVADWTKTGTASLVVSLEERRAKAKELLLDVEAKLGRNKMLKVFDVFKHADETALAECKKKLLEIFQGHRDFQSRFLEFLPHPLQL